MKNLFALIGVLVVGAGAAGWYLGWYKVAVTKKSDGDLEIQTNVDTQKLSGDSSAFFQKVGQMVSEKVQQSGQNGSSTPPSPPANTPGATQNPNSNLPLPSIPTLPKPGSNPLAVPNLPTLSPSSQGKP